MDWGKLSGAQVKKEHPDAIVVFIGANEGFGMKGPDGREVQCCGTDYAAIYANRVRQMMNTNRQEVARAVNAAIAVAAQPWRSQVRCSTPCRSSLQAAALIPLIDRDFTK